MRSDRLRQVTELQCIISIHWKTLERERERLRPKLTFSVPSHVQLYDSSFALLLVHVLASIIVDSGPFLLTFFVKVART